MKSKIMNFSDGPKEITEGMKCFSTNGQSGCHRREHNYEVKSIGNKLVTMTNGDKFYLETGCMQTEYIWGRLYSSKEAYERAMQSYKYIQEVRKLFEHTKLDLETAQKIEEILKSL